jgi:hypothetical protein
MSIAQKPIAGCSPIAARACRVAPFVIQPWVVTPTFITPTLHVDYVITGWVATYTFFAPVMTGTDFARGECIPVPPHFDVVYAYPFNDQVHVPGRNKCTRAA